MSTRPLLVVSLLTMAAPAFAQAPDQQPPPTDQPPPDTTTTTTSSTTTTTSTGTPPATGPSTTSSPPIEPPPAAQPEATPTLVKGKTELTFYGFVQLYDIYDSTQGFNEQCRTARSHAAGTYAGDHGQTQSSARHSRLGFKLAQPIQDGIKASAQFEMDFLGNQPSNPPATSESAFYQNGTFRFRHVFAKLETPYVDVLGGQYWSLVRLAARTSTRTASRSWVCPARRTSAPRSSASARRSRRRTSTSISRSPAQRPPRARVGDARRRRRASS